MNAKKQTGFTLPELMIVVVIIGIIAGFTIPNYQKSVARAYMRDARNNLIIIREANNVYRAQNGKFWPEDGSTQNLANINSNLRLNVIANTVTYTCTGVANASTFSCTAIRAGLTQTITQRPIVQPSLVCDADPYASTTNPCCTGGAC